MHLAFDGFLLVLPYKCAVTTIVEHVQNLMADLAHEKHHLARRKVVDDLAFVVIPVQP